LGWSIGEYKVVQGSLRCLAFALLGLVFEVIDDTHILLIQSRYGV
jgi:hypothetical protein